MIRYNHPEAIKKISEILLKNGYEVARVNKPNIEADIILTYHDKKLNILVRHLQKDHAYKNSTRPYKIYKVEAFENDEDRNIGNKNLDYVIGYNFNDDCFACVPIGEYKDKRSTVIHEKEDTRHEFFNSFLSMDEFLNKS
ncbi:hypothetical protein QUF86_20235 [Peribacillus sp. NJ11]|uniref:hypothetical protein n=1 Tax=Peribacillus sp. NJ11 TaxID=3055861 RepID=UPI0025A2894E|nr:hypothetical protein [Peribacillus sp. NJ11]MDM5223024.1 hypothetical protein [Peribacillus sp. NJ11]